MADKEKKVWVWDLEQFENFHSATFVDRDNPLNMRQFVIHRLRNDAKEYYTFLKEEVLGLIGFNNINYDYPLVHYFMSLIENYGGLADDINAAVLADSLYNEGSK